MGAKANRRKRQKQRAAAAQAATAAQATVTAGATQPVASSPSTGTVLEGRLIDSTPQMSQADAEVLYAADEEKLLNNAVSSFRKNQARDKAWYNAYSQVENELEPIIESGKIRESVATGLESYRDDIEEFRAKAENAKTNIQANIDAKKQFLKDTKNFKNESYSELRTRFSNEEVQAMRGFESGFGYRKAQLLDKGGSILNKLSFGKLGSQSSTRVQNYQKGILDGAMDAKRSVAEVTIANHERLMSAIEKNDPTAIRAGQKDSATIEWYANMRANHEKMAAAAAEKSGIKGALKGAGGKLAAFGAVLGLGAVIGNMFSGGHRSNAELYNPNGYSQYYS